MKIFEVEITNYRQYEGINKVQMSVDKDKNFTIIQGDNGGGKSNFMNAIIWCLYDDEMFKSKHNAGRDIINEKVLQNIKEGDSAEVSVKVTLGELEPEYIFERKQVFTKYNNGSSKGKVSFKGTNICKKGYDTISQPEWFIDKHFIPKDLRGFFFFDGEKMDDYFEETSSVKSNVEKIAQIDVLNDAITTLDDIRKDLNKDIAKHRPDQSATADHQNELLNSINSNVEEKNKIENRLFEIKKQLDEITNFLSNNSDAIVREIEKGLKSLKEQKKELLDKKVNLENDIRSKIAKTIPIVFASVALEHTKSVIDAETEKGTLPPNIKDVFIQELLDRGVCICGKNLNEDEECRKNLENLMKSLMPASVCIDATTGKYAIDLMLNKKNFLEDYSTYLKLKKDCEEKISELTNTIDAESEKLSKYDVEEISSKNELRIKLERERDQINVRKGTLGNKIIQEQSKYDELEEEIKRASKNEKLTKHLQDQKEYADYLKELMVEIKESIVDEVREKLEKGTREHFFNMIWKKEAFSDVRIIDTGRQYQISVRSEHGRECLGDLSAGERQVLALSFTAALYGVSGYSVPVIIDTPLGRISGAPRDNIASSLPEYLSETQVIMLATDTEYTDSVRNRLKNSVGAEYKIQHNTSTKTSRVVSYE